MSKHLRLLALLLCTVLLLSTGCSAQTKDFTVKELTITLTEEFKEASYNTYDGSFESRNMAVYILREEFELFDGGDVEVDLTYYTDLLIEGNGLDVQAQSKEGLTYFVFDKNADGDAYTYYAFTYEGTDAFWLVQICCRTENAEKLESAVFQYAKSVKV